MKAYRFEVYIGLHNKTTNKELSISKVKSELKEVANLFHIPFSLTTQTGGYLYTNSKYLIEKSIKLTFIIKEKRKMSTPILDNIKQTYNQESILIVRTKLNSNYYKGIKTDEINENY